MMTGLIRAWQISKSDSRVADFTNTSPRVWTAKIATLEKTTPAHQRILRAEGASAYLACLFAR